MADNGGRGRRGVQRPKVNNLRLVAEEIVADEVGRMVDRIPTVPGEIQIASTEVMMDTTRFWSQVDKQSQFRASKAGVALA